MLDTTTRFFLVLSLLTACTVDSETPVTEAAHDSAIEVGTPRRGGLALSAAGDLVWGTATELVASGAQPGEKVNLLVSRTGEGAGPCPARIGGQCLGVVPPFFTFSAVADGTGVARFPLTPDNRFGPAISGQAVAVRGAGGASSVLSAPQTFPVGPPEGWWASEVGCMLPFAVRQCAFTGVNPAAMHFTGNPNSKIGWVLPEVAGAPAPNTATLIDQLRNPCAFTASTSDTVAAANGINTPIVLAVADILNGLDPYAAPEPWPLGAFPAGPPPRVYPEAFDEAVSLVEPASWGNVIGGVMPLVDMGGEPGDCTTSFGTFSGSHDIVGFTYGYVFDARQGSAVEKGYMIQLDMETPYAVGTSATPNAIGNVVYGP